MSFAQRYNHYSSPFDFNSAGFPFKSLAECYAQFGPDKIYDIGLVFINSKNRFGASPVVAVTDGFNVNLPARYLEDCRDMMTDEQTISDINNGLCGFRINQFVKDGRRCHGVQWVDILPENDGANEQISIFDTADDSFGPGIPHDKVDWDNLGLRRRR